MAKNQRQGVIADANAFIALNWQQDPNHLKAKKVFEKLKSDHYLIWTNNYLVAEVITVLMQKLKKVDNVAKVGNQFYSPSAYLKTFQVNLKNQKESLKLFSTQEKPKLSFPDCTLITQAIKQKISTIFTFDQDIRHFPLLRKGFKFLP